MSAAEYTSDTHDELSRKFTFEVLGEALKRGATATEVMVLTESCVMAVYLALVKLGGDEKVLDLMVEGIRQRLAEKRLGGISPGETQQ